MNTDDQQAIDEINSATFVLGGVFGTLMKHRHTHPERVAMVYEKILMYMPMEEILKLMKELASVATIGRGPD